MRKATWRDDFLNSASFRYIGMTRIDRYIVGEFSRVFCICFITFLGLFIVGDFVSNHDELAKHAANHGGLLNVLIEFYGAKIPWFYDLIGRIVALVAAVFAITSLQRNNEMAAMMAAGVSTWRIIKPLVFSVGFVASLGALNRELVIPRLGSAIMRDARNFSGDDTVEIKNQYDHATGIYIEGQGIIQNTRTIEGPTFRLPVRIAERGTKIAAKQAVFVDANSDHPSGLLASNINEKHYHPDTTILDGDVALVLHPKTASWLKDGQLFVPTNLPFEQFVDGGGWRRYASTFSLIACARNESLDSGADVNVTIHQRLLQPVVDMLLVFLGIPVVVSRQSKNAFVAIGSCMIMIAVYVVSILAFQGLGLSYLISPSLAAWAPILIFTPLAVLISEPLRR